MNQIRFNDAALSSEAIFRLTAYVGDSRHETRKRRQSDVARDPCAFWRSAPSQSAPKSPGPIQQVGDDRQSGGLSRARDGPRSIARRPSATLSTASRSRGAAPGAGEFPSKLLLLFPSTPSSSTPFRPKLFMDAVVQMSLLEHLAQIAGPEVARQRLFFVVVRFVHLRLVPARMGRGTNPRLRSLLLQPHRCGRIGRTVEQSRPLRRLPPPRLSFFFLRIRKA